MAYLILESGGQRREIPVQGPVTVGRHKDCTVFLDDHKLSREHARVFFDGRVYMVKDLDSKNGTYLNGQLVREQKMLRPGDKIKVGDAVLTFALDKRDVNLPPEARGVPGEPPKPATQAVPAAPAPAALRGPRLDTERRERIAEHVQAVREASSTGPGGAARAFMTLCLLVIFGAGIYGFKLVFVWAFERVFAR